MDNLFFYIMPKMKKPIVGTCSVSKVAREYLPDCDGHTYKKKFLTMLVNHAELFGKLKKEGFSLETKYMTPRQVDLVHRYCKIPEQYSE